MRTRYQDQPPFLTKDGSTVRELMHPARHGNARQSLAEARVPAGFETLHHRHLQSEELYHVTHGAGLMALGPERFEVGPGDTVLIPPGTPHSIKSLGPGELVVLCCSSPAYAHEDTELEPGSRP